MPHRPPTLDAHTLGLLRSRLPEVAGHTIEAVTAEVPAYAGGFDDALGANIEQAVQMAFAGSDFWAGRVIRFAE